MKNFGKILLTLQYLLSCEPGEGSAKIDVYTETDNGFSLTLEKELGTFSAEGFSVSNPAGNDVINCLVYA